jgi:hypothetical protein
MSTHYQVGDRVILNDHYDGDYLRFDEGGYRIGAVSEVVAPGRLYSIALDGYHNRFVDFSVSEFRLLDVCAIVVEGQIVKDSLDAANAKRIAREYADQCLRVCIIQHARTIDPASLVKA